MMDISCIMIKCLILSCHSFSGHFRAVNINSVTVPHPSEGNISFQPKVIFAVAQGTRPEIITLRLTKTGVCLTSEPSTAPLQISGPGRQGEPKAERSGGGEACAAGKSSFSRLEKESEWWKAEIAARDWPCSGQQPHQQWPSSHQSEREVVVFFFF